MYNRCRVTVCSEDRTEMQAFCAVFRPEFRQELTERDRDFERFLADGKKSFLPGTRNSNTLL